MRQFLKIYVRFSISRLIIFLTFFVLNSTWCFRKKENVRQDRARRRIASLIINSCGTKSTSRRRLDDIHASIYIYTSYISNPILATHLRAKLSMTHSSDAPFAYPLSPNGLLSNGRDYAHSGRLKTLHDSTWKNVRKERNTNYAYVGDQYRSMFNSHVLFF